VSHTRRFYAPALDGIRALAFGLVFASHIPGGTLFPGGFGVTIFFFLSGYLITTLLRLEYEQTGRIDIPRFFGRRFLRIFPPYYLTLALVWGLGLSGWVLRRGEPVILESLGPLLWQLGFATNYFLTSHGPHGLPPGSEVYWSLAVEEHFYLLFPFASLALFRFASPRTRAPVLYAVCGLVLAWRLLLWLVLDPADSARITYATDTRIDAILFGAALAVGPNPGLTSAHQARVRPTPLGFPGQQGLLSWITRGAVALGLAGQKTGGAPTLPLERPWSVRWGWPLFWLSGLGLLLTLVPRDPTFRETVRYTLQGLLLLPVYAAILANPGSLVSRWLAHPGLRWLGGLSYTLYLVHHSLIWLARSYLTHPLLVAAAALAGSILYAMLLDRIVDRPLARMRAAMRIVPAGDRGTSP
jgi:peptidoglycan/LPS O-acetylase OafA/YrhL